MDIASLFNILTELLILIGMLGCFMRIRALEKKLDELLDVPDEEDVN